MEKEEERQQCPRRSKQQKRRQKTTTPQAPLLPSAKALAGRLLSPLVGPCSGPLQGRGNGGGHFKSPCEFKDACHATATPTCSPSITSLTPVSSASISQAYCARHTGRETKEGKVPPPRRLLPRHYAAHHPHPPPPPPPPPASHQRSPRRALPQLAPAFGHRQRHGLPLLQRLPRPHGPGHPGLWHLQPRTRGPSPYPPTHPPHLLLHPPTHPPTHPPHKKANGEYDTRMRIYTSQSTNDTFIVFRFTVQPHGEVIHINRTMSPCNFLGEGCTGQVGNVFFSTHPPTHPPLPSSSQHGLRLIHPPTHPPTHPPSQVHGKFQAGFNSLVATVDDWTPYLDGKKVYVFGTSLGGALQLFMALWLWKVRLSPTHPPTHLIHPPTHPPTLLLRSKASRLPLV